MHIAQELLSLTGELEGRLMLEDAGGQAQQARQAVVLDGSILLVQNLTAFVGADEGRICRQLEVTNIKG